MTVQHFKAFLKDEDGAAAFEYILIIATLSIPLIPFSYEMKVTLDRLFSDLANTLKQVSFDIAG